MPTYKAPVEDVKFLLNDVFHMERYGNMPGFADATPDVVAAILEEAAKFAEESHAGGHFARIGLRRYRCSRKACRAFNESGRISSECFTFRKSARRS